MRDTQFHQASRYHDERNFKEALPLWKEMVSIASGTSNDNQPHDLYTYLIHLGECYSELEDYANAISTLKCAVEIGDKLQEELLFIPISELAWLYQETGDKIQAIDLYLKALHTSDADYSFYILIHLAEIYEYTSFAKTVDCLEKALKIAVQGGNHENIFLVIEKLVVFHQSRDHFSEASKFAKQGIALLKETLHSPDTHILLASVLEGAGYIDETLTELDLIKKMLSSWSEEDLDSFWFQEMDILQIRASVELKRTNLEGALSLYEDARKVISSEDTEVLCTLLFEMGRTLLNHEHHQHAEKNLLAAVDLAKEINFELVLSESQALLGTLYYETGRYEQAIAILKNQVENERERNNLVNLCATLNNLAASYRQIGEISIAEKLYEETGQLSNQLSPSDQVLYYQNTSAIHSIWGKDDSSLKHAKRALGLAIEHKIDTMIPGVKKSVAEALYALGHFESSIIQLKEIVESPLISQFPSKQMSIYNLMGTNYSNIKDFKSAEFYLLKAKKLVEHHDMKAEYPTVSTNLGVLYLNIRKHAKAEPYLKKALEMDEKLGQLTQLSTDFHNLGFLYFDQNQYKKALPYFQKAIQLTEKLRLQGNDDQRLSYQNQEYNTYELLTDTLIRLKKGDEAIQVLERHKNREMLRKMQLNASSTNFKNIQKVLPQNACLIILGNSRNNDLVGFAVSKSKTKALTISLKPYFDKTYPGDKKSQIYLEKANQIIASKGKLTTQKENHPQLHLAYRSGDAKKMAALIHYYRHRLNRDPRVWHPKKTSTDTEIGHFLYNVLLSPFEEFITDTQQLIMITDDLLELIPYDTLVKSNNTYLIENLTIQQVPSISVMKHLLQISPVKKIHNILALGVEKYSQTMGINEEQRIDSNSETEEVLSDSSREQKSIVSSLASMNLKDLPYVREELSNISTSDLKVSILIGKKLTPERIKSNSDNNHLTEFDALHFAVHAINLPSDPRQSALILNQENTNETPYLFLPEIERLDVNCQLVFLSACETALGKFFGGDATASISNAFLIAGSQKVIATLWPVHDQHTMLFVQEFYKQLSKKRIEHALATTKRKCILGHLGEELRKSIYWASFVLYG